MNSNNPYIKEILYKQAAILALITIFYNIIEGIISIFFGLGDETIALFGFGMDSFVEVISGVGIWHMMRRLNRNNDNTNPDIFEQQALRITGMSFYILTFALIGTVALNLYHNHSPGTTLWGIIVSIISIVTMWLLIHYKVKVGKQLNSQAILTDATCTKTCLYLSFVLLLSSAGYELTNVGGLDSMGAILIAVFSFKEGRESFQKARGITCCSCVETYIKGN
jgi:divalent metal cation (Fe/Co/Zn/Cd) transporter